ncbi:bacterial chemotaxis sensory transducer domain protein [Burkholderia thailandensis]|uniref:Bacterial chemotaxis sensory transducer domain protein n=1 Tax=Burkholderia thailandensis TaxID=57975 RepID=A0AAW9CZ71_BURTH|nr:bacterial chemotaxis sensory transducer domain protein [Burkholderia thailandensis]
MWLIGNVRPTFVANRTILRATVARIRTPAACLAFARRSAGRRARNGGFYPTQEKKRLP